MENNKSKNKVFILTGVSLAGKTTKALKLKEEYKNSVIVKDILKAQDLLTEGKDVIVDLPNLNRGARTPFIDLARKFGAEIISYAFIVSLQDVLARAEKYSLAVNPTYVSEELQQLQWPKDKSETDRLSVVTIDGEEKEVIGSN